MKTDAETMRLWEDLLNAARNQHNLMELSYDFQRIAERLESDETSIKPPLSNDFMSLVQGAKELAESFVNQKADIENCYQRIAWQFAEHAYDLHQGDHVECTHYNGQLQVVSADYLYVSDMEIGSLTLKGSILKKEGFVESVNIGCRSRKQRGPQVPTHCQTKVMLTNPEWDRPGKRRQCATN